VPNGTLHEEIAIAEVVATVADSRQEKHNDNFCRSTITSLISPYATNRLTTRLAIDANRVAIITLEV